MRRGEMGRGRMGEVVEVEVVEGVERVEYFKIPSSESLPRFIGGLGVG